MYKPHKCECRPFFEYRRPFLVGRFLGFEDRRRNTLPSCSGGQGEGISIKKKVVKIDSLLTIFASFFDTLRPLGNDGFEQSIWGFRTIHKHCVDNIFRL